MPWLRTENLTPPAAENQQQPAGAPVDLPGEFKVYMREHPEDIRQAWRVTEAILGELKREVEAAGGHLTVFYVPTVAAIYPEAWEATKRKWGLNDEEWDIAQVEPVLAKICARQRIDFIHSLSRLRDAAQRPDAADDSGASSSGLEAALRRPHAPTVDRDSVVVAGDLPADAGEVRRGPRAQVRGRGDRRTAAAGHDDGEAPRPGLVAVHPGAAGLRRSSVEQCRLAPLLLAQQVALHLDPLTVR